MLHNPFQLIFTGKLVKLVATEYRSVLANVLGANVTSSALTNTALHAKLESGIYLSLIKAELDKSLKCELDHDRRSAENCNLVCVKAKLLNVVGNESNVAVPALLLTVDGEVYVDTGGCSSIPRGSP